MNEDKSAYEKYFKINISGKAVSRSFAGALSVSLVLIAGLRYFAPGIPHYLFPLIAGGLSGGLFVWFIGLGVNRCSCSKCGNPLAKIRWPKTKEEMLWGGWTCPKCGTSVDRFGQPRESNCQER